MLLDRIVVEPTEPVAGLVLWLHGLGASGDDFVPLVPILGLPHVRWVFPHAPDQAVTLNRGMVMPSWYDIRSLDPGPEREDLGQLRVSSDAVLALVRHEIARGAPADRVVIAGFSQGGAVALDLLTRAPFRFRGGLVLSSYLAGAEHLELHPANAETPVWFGHGEHDEVVPMWRGRAAHDQLHALGRPVSWDDYGMGHELCNREASDLRRHLHAWLA